MAHRNDFYLINRLNEIGSAQLHYQHIYDDITKFNVEDVLSNVIKDVYSNYILNCWYYHICSTLFIKEIVPCSHAGILIQG